MDKKIFWVLIEGQCGNETSISINIPAGITKEQTSKFDDLFSEKVCEYGEQNNEDYSGLDYHDIIEEVAAEMGIVFEYPPADYVIYI